MHRSQTIRIGSRPSPMALAQAERVCGELAAHVPDVTTELH